MKLIAHDAGLDPDPSRVIARLFLPSEGTLTSRSRVEQIVGRVLAMSDSEVAETAERAVAEYGIPHQDAEAILIAHADAVAELTVREHAMTRTQEIVLGSAFTADYAVEGAALCNPSTVVHPSQEGLEPGQLRVAVSLRCIGEGHISSIGFAEAVIGPDTWWFGERATPLERPAIDVGEWSRAHFSRTLEDEGSLTELASTVLAPLPERFGRHDLENSISALPHQLSMRPDSVAPLNALRDVALSAYRAEFAPGSSLSARMLLPVTAEEHNGVEDARFVRFTDANGATDYRATYTAYDGRRIAPRLITSPDLVSFAFHRLGGDGARNKGMALFPRMVGGRHLALTRVDGENLSLASSHDGLIWEGLGVLHTPQEPWELIQLGNCGSPIETPEGWFVLTHGVGPLRTYSLGALLLDLDDPSRVIRRTVAPLLRPEQGMRDGYVPRVVYSCGGIVHDGTLWVPVGVGDSRIRVFSAGLDELLASMEPCP